MAKRIMPTKNSSDNIGNRTRDLPVCSAVPQPTAPPHVDMNAAVPNPHIGKRFFSYANRPEWLCDSPCLLRSGYQRYCRVIKKTET